MKTLYVNGRFLSQPLAGVQRFGVEICKELALLIPDLKIVVPRGVKIDEDVLKPCVMEVGNLQGTIWEQIDLNNFMRSKGALLLNLCNTAPLGYDRNIVTIHDLGVFRNSSWYDWKFANWYKFLTPKIAKKAKVILTVSEFSKSEIIEVLKVNSEKVHVVYNGASKQVVQVQPQPKEKLVIHIGTQSERKNVKMMVDCYTQSCPNDFKLVLCGNVDNNLSLTASNLDNMNGIEVISGASDIEVSALLAKASYVLSASEYEGFGLPILEGLANNAKPILSNIPVYKELFSEVALFFNLDSPDELSEVFKSLNQIEKSIDEEVVANHLNRYNFAKSAKSIKSIIQSL
ncbi:MAG: glycosyltransferase involved in cell wall biosynthesis [Bacteroidia bacterium]|jgi:glycosyltransferase involved in cell wall biosynthesis